MELKEYQASALDAFTRWREAVERARLDAEAAVAALQGVRLPVALRNAPGEGGSGTMTPL